MHLMAGCIWHLASRESPKGRNAAGQAVAAELCRRLWTPVPLPWHVTPQLQTAKQADALAQSFPGLKSTQSTSKWLV